MLSQDYPLFDSEGIEERGDYTLSPYTLLLNGDG